MIKRGKGNSNVAYEEVIDTLIIRSSDLVPLVANVF